MAPTLSECDQHPGSAGRRATRDNKKLEDLFAFKSLVTSCGTPMLPTKLRLVIRPSRKRSRFNDNESGCKLRKS
jgi:hypothetical protein